MPARTRNTTYIPGKGAITQKPSGKKTFQGSGPAPAGTTKEPEATYLTTPTVTVSGGKVSASGFPSRAAAKRAVATRKRKRARSYLQTSQTERRRESASAETRAKATEKAVKAPRRVEAVKPKAEEPKVLTPEGPTPAIRKQEVIDARAFAKEQNRPMPKVVRKQPKVAKGMDPATAVMSSVPGRGPQLTRERRVEARQELRKAKRAVRKSGSNAELRSPIIQTPEQSKVAKTVLRIGEKEGANRKEKLASLVTGAQESGFKNLSGGMGSSSGWRQELAEYYANPTNVKASARRFFEEAKSDTDGGRGRNESIADLAQTIQASGAGASYYADNEPEARDLLRQYNQGKADPKAVKRYQAAKTEAEKLGLKVAKGALEPAPKKVVTRYKAIDKAATALEKAGVPYVYGGGHEAGTPKNPKAGLDCSSSTVWVLNKAGVKIPNIVSGEFGNYLPPGPGAVTVFYNDGHVFMRIGDRYFGTSASNPSSGPGFIEGGYSQDYLSQYNVAHVPGLGKKQALQLGIKPGDFASAPGITFSNGGATATINSGAGTTQTKAAFSKAPIKLTPMQRYRRVGKRLKAVGVGESAEAEESPTLKRLEEKYARAA